MSPWRTEKHFVSWLALCPNNKISGGKLLSRRTLKSASRARTILKMSAQGLLHSQSALGAFCRRMCGRLGIPKGITAVAHKLALLVYRMIKLGRQYIDIGQERYEQKYRERLLKHLARKANAFVFSVGSFYVQLSSLGKRKSEANSDGPVESFTFEQDHLVGQRARISDLEHVGFVPFELGSVA